MSSIDRRSSVLGAATFVRYYDERLKPPICQFLQRSSPPSMQIRVRRNCRASRMDYAILLGCSGLIENLAPSVRDVGGAHGLFEHRQQRAVDVCGRACGIEEIRRRAGLQRRRNVLDVVVGVAVFVIEDRAGIRDGLIRDVKNSDGDSAVLYLRAVVGAVRFVVWAVFGYDARRVLIGNICGRRPRPGTVCGPPASAPLRLIILRSISDDERRKAVRWTCWFRSRRW